MSSGLKAYSTNGNTDHEMSCQGLHVVAKPMGPVCNLRCEYCFYLEKRALYNKGEDCRMPDKVLACFIQSYIEGQPTPDVDFVWQ